MQTRAILLTILQETGFTGCTLYFLLHLFQFSSLFIHLFLSPLDVTSELLLCIILFWLTASCSPDDFLRLSRITTCVLYNQMSLKR